MTKVKAIAPLTLEAERVTEKFGPFEGMTRTELYQNGEKVAIIPPQTKQPRKNQRKVNLKGWEFKLKWKKE